MIEEIKLLIPLLQSAGHGVFWLVLAVLAVDILKYLIVVGGVVWIGVKVVASFAKVATQGERADTRLVALRTYGYLNDSSYRDHEERAQLLKLLHDNPFNKDA